MLFSFRTILFAVAINIVYAPASNIHAQDATPFTPATLLRVTLTPHDVYRGTFVAASDTTLIILTASNTRTIPLSSITQLELSSGRRLGIGGGIAGLLLGGAAGAALGCAANRDSYGVFCGGQSDTKVAIGATLGAITGGAAGGLLFRRERWTPLDPSRLRTISR